MNTRNFFTLSSMGLLVVLLTMGTGCIEEKKQYDTASGGDHNRKQAKKLFVGQNVTDSIDDPAGDHTDWKELRIREGGNLSLTVAIDNTNGMKGFVSIKDGFGVELERRPINHSDRLYTFDKVPVYQGEYFVEIFVDAGRSTYTVGASFEPFNKGVVVARPPQDNFNSDQTQRPNTGNPGGKARPGGNAGVGKIDPPPLDPPPEEGGEDTVALRGKISRCVPLDEGGSQLIISGFGSRDGVVAGMRGVIVGLGQGFRVTNVRANSATARTAAESDVLSPYKTVVLKVKKK